MSPNPMIPPISPMGIPPSVMPPGGMPPGGGPGMMDEAEPTGQPDINMLIQMLMGGAVQGMSQTATDPNTLMQALMAQRGPAPMAPPPGSMPPMM